MENSSMFLRGQVWYWEDPIYGRKENNLEVSIGEAIMRFNRYCIIAQTTETIAKSSVLVIPCSSTNNTPHDVPIPLAHVFHENYTYARTRSIFPVHPKFLQRYICTLSENTMKQIEAEICKMLLPSVFSTTSGEIFKELFNCDKNSNYHEPIRQNLDFVEKNIRSFIRDHLVKSSNKDVISAHELKDAFDQYCIIHNLDLVEDIVEFLDTFTKVTNNTGQRFIDKSKYNVTEFRGIKIRGNLKLSIILSERDLINPSDPQKLSKWTEDTINEFLNEYNNNGVEVASDKFGLKPSTANNYWYRWKDKLESNPPIRTTPKVPPTIDIQKSISKVSNLIRDYLREINIYDDIQETDKKYEMNIISFYNNIGTCIYYSLLELLSIRKDDGNENFYIPNINENSNYLDTWHFFDKAYHDKRISMNKNGLDLINAYRKYFPNKKGIDQDFITKLKPRLISKIALCDDEVQKICDVISEKFCGITIKSE